MAATQRSTQSATTFTQPCLQLLQLQASLAVPFPFPCAARTWYCCIIIICGCHIIMPGGAPGGMPGMPPGPPMLPAAAAAAASPPPLRLPPGAAEVPLAALLVPLVPLPAESPLASGAAAASGQGGLGSAAAAAAAGMAIMPFICTGGRHHCREEVRMKGIQIGKKREVQQPANPGAAGATAQPCSTAGTRQRHPAAQQAHSSAAGPTTQASLLPAWPWGWRRNAPAEQRRAWACLPACPVACLPPAPPPRLPCHRREPRAPAAGVVGRTAPEQS